MRRVLLASCGLLLASVYFIGGKSGSAGGGLDENPRLRSAIKPDRDDGVRFISPRGSDSNDGLSWGEGTMGQMGTGFAQNWRPAAIGTQNIRGSGFLRHNRPSNS